MENSREHIENSIDLWAAVDNLPPKYRAVLLFLAMGMTQVEIAELLERDQREISAILKNARALVKSLQNERIW